MTALTRSLWLFAVAFGVPQTLNELTRKSYLELLEIAPTVQFSSTAYESWRNDLEAEKQRESKRLEQEEKKLQESIRQQRARLNTLNRQPHKDTEPMTEERRQVHCSIVKAVRQLQDKRTERSHGLPVKYDNRLAKAELLEHWPGKLAEIRRARLEDRAHLRAHGDVMDTGVRAVGDGQAKDVKLGQDTIRELKGYGLMPPELDDAAIRGYAQRLGDTIAAHSDLKIPVQVTVLQSKEINAFALPGAYLFVTTGLLEKAASESELAGVMAHEMAHAAARHGHRLMMRATAANIVYQAAQVAALIFTGGAAGIGAYYALQYGFFGLGMVLNLALLGVNREFEAEADQLGVQYCWHAGYDPRGFITFFDQMANEEGYVKSASWFRTHPPFYERIVSTFSEIEYLPAKDNLRVDAAEFHEMQKRLTTEIRKRQDRKAPALRRFPECDDEPPLKDSGPDRAPTGSDHDSWCAIFPIRPSPIPFR
ncbi:MAG: M48 family metalloprotease [Acidobacteria bacterium]|nr:M48 family metalloprotease [Acidobacteriota bacterium]